MIQVLIPSDFEFLKYDAQIKDLYEKNQKKINDSNSYEFIKNNTLFYDDALKRICINYNYLIVERVINENELQKLYFDSSKKFSKSFTSMDEKEKRNTIVEMLSDYFISNNDFPILITTLIEDDTEELKLELRDRLVYVSTMGLLDSTNPQDLKKCKKNAVSR